MKGSISRFFAGLLSNKGIKVVALLLGVVTWYAIREEISFEKEVTRIPIDILVDEGWAVLNMEPREATVRFQGPESSVWNLNRDNVRIQVDITGRTDEQPLYVDLDPAHVQTPGGVRTVDIRPPLISLSVDQVGETNLPVRADMKDNLPEGFEVEAVVCRPATVTLHGPRQRLAQVEAIFTAPIDLAGRMGSFDLQEVLNVPGDNWEGWVDPSIVTVEVTVEERAATRAFENVPIRVLAGSGRQVEVGLLPDTVQVVLAGRAERLDALDPAAVFAYVDCEGLDAGGSYDLPVTVHAPGSLTVQEVEPRSVKTTLGAL